MKKLILSVFILSISLSSIAQVGGRTSFDFLRLTENARVAGIGGENISVGTDDINMMFYNPALLNDSMGGWASVNYMPHYADVKKTSAVYGLPSEKYGTWGIGLEYINYGDFDERDEAGQVLGDFGAQEFALTVSQSHTQGPFTLGTSLKFAGSQLAGYSAYAAMLDLGGIYKHPTREFTVGMLFKNVGLVFKNYRPEIQSITPFDIQLGASYKLEHVPVRLSLTAHHLYQLDIVYLDPYRQTTFDEEGNEVAEEKKLGDKIARHFVVGMEFLLSEHLNFRAGYNHLRRKELRLENVSGGAGFSFGFMVRIKTFEFAYTRTFYHVVGGRNVLTLSANLKNMFH